MTTLTVPERGAPPIPPDWGSVHDGPAAAGGAVPKYLLQRTETPEDPIDSSMEVIEISGGSIREFCDVVVIGSGAGGASAALTFVERGLDVVIVEEGDYFRREDFSGPPLERVIRMYRDGGTTTTLGRDMIPLPMGRTVGGTTTVNSGTCFRPPARVLRAWESQTGVDGIDPQSMDRHFRRAEKFLNVRPVPWALLGPNGWLTHAGSRAVRATGGPILRNITACHGTGQCAFGCPTDAKQAMHLSYLPRAVRRGARLYARTKAEWIVTDDGRASGITARFRGGGTLSVRAKRVVVACGAVGTPLLLMRNRLGNQRHLGRHLRIHPATAVVGEFADPIFGWRGTLQPYYVDSMFDTHEVMLEATNSVPSVAAGVVPGFGLAAKEILARFPYFATLGLLVSDSSEGRVLRMPGGQAFITYSLNERDTRNLLMGSALACEVLLAAGAKAVIPGVKGAEPVVDEEGVSALRRRAPRPASVKLQAYHPMGTARMGIDPSRSVVDGRLACHGTPGLHITDASVFPSCLGVNPQITIMAFADRAAEMIAESI